MSEDTIVKIQGLGKKFKLYNNSQDRLKEWLSLGFITKHTEFWALKNISLEVKKGECFGIIGENGAGKSTLLKILTGALWPSTGSVEMEGRALSLLELGTGFNPELTGKQNVLSSASLLGFPDDYITEEKLKFIQEFADIGEFFDQPVRIYSSGMHVRLAFSMFMFMEPEIFIIDEALSVGDIFFSQKCFTRIRELMDKGVTFIFVSHDLNAMQNLSDRIMLLNYGKCAFEGKPEEAVARYHAIRTENKSLPSKNKANEETQVSSSITDPEEALSHSVLNGKDRHGNGEMKIIAARVTNKKGEDTLSASMMDELKFHLYFKAFKKIKDPNFGIIIHDKLGNLIFSCNTQNLKTSMPDMEAEEERRVAFKLKMAIGPGEYTFALVCGQSTEDLDLNRGITCDRHNSLGPLIVLFDFSKAVPPFYGIAQLPMEIMDA